MKDTIIWRYPFDLGIQGLDVHPNGLKNFFWENPQKWRRYSFNGFHESINPSVQRCKKPEIEPGSMRGIHVEKIDSWQRILFVLSIGECIVLLCILVTKNM